MEYVVRWEYNSYCIIYDNTMNNSYEEHNYSGSQKYEDTHGTLHASGLQIILSLNKF